MPSVISFRKKTVLLLFLFLVLILSLIALIFLSTNKRAVRDLAQESLIRQSNLTHAAADNMEAFMAVAVRSVALLSQSYGMTADGVKRQAVLDQYVRDRLGTPIVGVVLTDKKGLVIANASRDSSSAIGIDLSDRDYFRWAMTASQGAVFVSDPTIARLGASKDKEVILIATPWMKDGQFQGAVAISTQLDLFVDYYVSSIFAPPATVYVFDQKGTVLVAPAAMVGANIFDLLRKSPFPGSDLLEREFHTILAKDQSGGLETILPQGPDMELTSSLVTNAPVFVPSDSKTWKLIVVTPEAAAVSLTAPVYIQEISLLIGGFFVILIAAILILSRLRIELV